MPQITDENHRLTFCTKRSFIPNSNPFYPGAFPDPFSFSFRFLSPKTKCNSQKTTSESKPITLNIEATDMVRALEIEMSKTKRSACVAKLIVAKIPQHNNRIASL